MSLTQQKPITKGGQKIYICTLFMQSPFNLTKLGGLPWVHLRQDKRSPVAVTLYAA